MKIPVVRKKWYERSLLPLEKAKVKLLLSLIAMKIPVVRKKWYEPSLLPLEKAKVKLLLSLIAVKIPVVRGRNGINQAFSSGRRWQAYA